jgi:hypothetical protein
LYGHNAISSFQISSLFTFFPLLITQYTNSSLYFPSTAKTLTKLSSPLLHFSILLTSSTGSATPPNAEIVDKFALNPEALSNFASVNGSADAAQAAD